MLCNILLNAVTRIFNLLNILHNNFVPKAQPSRYGEMSLL